MTRILIADDHPFILAGLEAVLHNSEFKVVRAVANGIGALDALQDARPDILLLDVAMPGLSGIGASAGTRAAPGAQSRLADRQP